MGAGAYPVGVTKRKEVPNSKEGTRNFKAFVSGEYKGIFLTPEEAHRAWQMGRADHLEEAVLWWQFDPEINHSFNQTVAMALFDRADRLRDDAANGRETLIC